MIEKLWIYEILPVQISLLSTYPPKSLFVKNEYGSERWAYASGDPTADGEVDVCRGDRFLQHEMDYQSTRSY